MLGDFWGIEKHLPEWADGRGASAVLVYSGRGMAVWNALELEKAPADYAQIVEGNPMLEQCVRPDPRKRDRFLRTVARRGVAGALRFAEDGCWMSRTMMRPWRWLLRRIHRAKHWRRGA